MKILEFDSDSDYLILLHDDMQPDSWREILGPEFTPFYSTLFHSFSLFLSLFCRWILIFSLQMSMNISGINPYSLFHLMIDFTYNHGFYLSLCWYVCDLKEGFTITGWFYSNNLSCFRVVQLQQLIMPWNVSTTTTYHAPKLILVGINFVWN